jgi:hypothetical protein
VADLANLRISVDSRDVKSATNDLNNLSRASGNAERSANSLTNAAKLFGGALAAVGIFGLATGIAKANAEFQSLNASLKVATGSTAAASAAFDEIRKFAATTPYQLNQTVEAFLKLKNLGLDPSMASLRSYGNTAASMGKSLNQMIEAVADASTLEFERLKEFGIRAKQQKDTVTFTFQGVSTTVKKNSEEIQQYLINIGNTQFAGAMDEQMKTLNGRMSNLKDNIDNLYVTLGNAGATNIFSQALTAASSAVTYLTTNLNSILRAIEVTMVAVAGMAAAFVAFRAALGIQAIVAYITQMMALNIALGATTTASALAGVGIKGLQAALASTGWGLALVAIGALVGAIYSLATAQSRAREETNGHIASLKALSQARSVGWAQARTERELEARLLERDIRLLKQKQSAQGARGQAEGAGYVASTVAAKQERLDALRIGIKEADVLKEQADAMAAITVPAAAASAGIAATGEAAKKAVDPLEKYRDALADMIEEGEKIGKTPEQIKALEVQKLVAGALALKNKELAASIREVGAANAAKEMAFGISEKLKEYAKAIEETNKAHNANMTSLKGEAKLLGLVGVEREKASLALEREAYVLKFGEKAWQEYYAARLAGINNKSVFDKDIQALQTLANNLETAAGMIGGKGGRALQGIFKMEVELADGSTQKISDAIAKTFPQLGEALASVISGMQLGNLVGGMTGSKTGGTVGGGIGGALGKKLLTDNLAKIAPELGKFAGPLGALAGGILGGVIGGLMKKTKTGSVTLNQIAGGAMERTLTGNSAALKDVANNMANGLLKGLGNIAEQLGGVLGGNVKVSLGMRKKDYVVDPTGAGRTKGAGVKNFGTDEAAAVAYVTQLAIQQGIVTGISAGAQTLIRAGNDLNEQVQKALKFDQVFKDLQSQSDPLQFSLDELSVEMEKLKVIFKEAGATAADYAKLEELYAIKQAKATFEANRPRRELEIQLMEAQGNATGALAAQRALELESMDASLRGLQEQIYAAEDASKAAQELADAQQKAAEEAAALAEATLALANDRRSLEIDLMEALGDSSGALAERRKIELAAMDESLRGLQEQIWAAIDAKRAADEAAAATKALAEEQAKQVEAAAKLAADRRELEIQLLEAQGFAVEALAARRAIELEATEASLRGLKEQIWAAQAKAEADAAAAKAAEDAAKVQEKAAQDAADAMQKYADTLANVSQTVVDEINRLRGINASSSSVLLKAQFATLTAQARTGNLEALGKLPELSRSIEEATLGSATSALEVARIRAWLSASLSETLGAQNASNAEAATTGAGLVFDGNQTSMASNSAETADGISNMRNEMYNVLYQVAKNTGKSYELMDRWDGDGLPDIREDASDYY